MMMMMMMMMIIIIIIIIISGRRRINTMTITPVWLPSRQTKMSSSPLHTKNTGGN